LTWLATLRWLLPAALPPVLAAFVLYRSDVRREPVPLVVLTFILGALAGGISAYLIALASRWTGLEIRSSAVGEGPALLFLFCLVAPLGEITKVFATWPAFLTEQFDEPYDGIVYAGVAALGFSAVESAVVLHSHPSGLVWIARSLLALPAHLFFACLWGYALGRAKQGRKRPTTIFPVAWVFATAAHGLYAHIVYGRGPGAMLGVVPLLMAMGGVAWVAARDLKRRGDRPSREFSARVGEGRLSRVSLAVLAEPPSLHAVRDALRRRGRPIMARWIFLGALVTVGTMVAGVSTSVAVGHWIHIDFSVVDEHDAATTAPLVLLGLGLLSAFPVSGFLVARASNVPTLLEPALGAALAIALVCAVLGLMAPIALVFAFAFSPIAFGLSCFGAWAGLPTA
jgi:RsiW-degrading membrane proteinase PrsW (M82 family)